MASSYSKLHFTDTSMATLLAYRPDVECIEALKLDGHDLLVKYGHVPPPISWYREPEDTCACAGITMGEDQHRLYGLFYSRSIMHPDLYRMWFKQFETASGDIEYTGVDMPIIALTGMDYDTPTTKMSQYVLSDIYPYLEENGLSGWSWAIPEDDISKYSLIFSRYGYIFVVFPVWYRMYPAFYQAILMFKELNGDIVGAGMMGSLSFWSEKEWHAEPLVTNVVDLDGYFIFRQERSRTFPHNWGHDEFFRRWSNPRTIHPGPGDPDELRSPMNAGTIGIRELIDSLLGSDIYNPVHIKLNQQHMVNPCVTNDYDAITVSHAGRRLYGVKNSYIMEYDIDYVGFFCTDSENEISLENKSLLPTGGLQNFRVKNTSEHTSVYGMTIDVTETDTGSSQLITVGDIAPQESKVVGINLRPTSVLGWDADVSYSIMV